MIRKEILLCEIENDEPEDKQSKKSRLLTPTATVRNPGSWYFSCLLLPKVFNDWLTHTNGRKMID